MSITLDQIWRHPIKGIGAERISGAFMAPDCALPLDRAYAVIEAGADPLQGQWQPCRNFLRGAKAPQLMAITACCLDNGTIRLSHPDLPDHIFDPKGDHSNLIAWLGTIYPPERPAPMAVVAAPKSGMTDANFASISILNLASLRALEARADMSLDPRRFRGNLWLEGLAPWEELDLIGATLVIGEARLKIVEPITRCRATEANPDTGVRDVPTLQILQSGWDHSEFGVYAETTQAGHIAQGDKVEIIW